MGGKAENITYILDTINSEGIDVRQFSAQMTEWIVDNISESFDKKCFSLYKEIFDMFTQIFAQSKQVSVPMDILRMALYERIQEGKIERKEKKDIPITPQIIEKTQEVKMELPIPSHIL